MSRLLARELSGRKWSVDRWEKSEGSKESEGSNRTHAARFGDHGSWQRPPRIEECKECKGSGKDLPNCLICLNAERLCGSAGASPWGDENSVSMVLLVLLTSVAPSLCIFFSPKGAR